MLAGSDSDAAGTAGLDELDRDALGARFAELYGGPPPGRLGSSLLRRAIAYRLLETRQGKLKPVLHRRLVKLARDLKETGTVSVAAPNITAAILDGNQPVDLTAQRLTKLPMFPHVWDDQRRLLGFC